MGIIKTAKTLWVKALQTVTLRDTGGHVQTLLGGGFSFGTESKDYLLKAYGSNPYVFMVIDRICQRLVQIDKRLLDKNEKEIENPDFKELLEKPNDKEDGSAFLYRAAATYLAAGECFVIRRQQLGEDDQYFVPINYNVTINQDVKGNVLTYTVTEFGSAETYLKNEVLHISKPDITFDTNHGFSTLRAIRKVWESNNEVWSSEAALHKNKGVSGVLYSSGNRPMTDIEQKNLQKKYDDEATGAANFGKVKVSTSQLNYVQMGMNPNDLKSIETRIEHLRTICASYNVDSKLFGDPAASTYNNMAEAQRAMIINAVIPLSKILLPKIIEFMAFSVLKQYTMSLNEDSILELQLTKNEKSARVGREVIQGILTPGQAKEMLYPELVEETEGAAPTVPVGQTAAATVQDILSLQEAILSGATSRESAIAILTQFHGLTEAEAINIIGTQSDEGQ